MTIIQQVRGIEDQVEAEKQARLKEIGSSYTGQKREINAKIKALQLKLEGIEKENGEEVQGVRKDYQNQLERTYGKNIPAWLQAQGDEFQAYSDSLTFNSELAKIRELHPKLTLKDLIAASRAYRTITNSGLDGENKSLAERHFVDSFATAFNVDPDSLLRLMNSYLAGNSQGFPQNYSINPFVGNARGILGAGENDAALVFPFLEEKTRNGTLQDLLVTHSSDIFASENSSVDVEGHRVPTGINLSSLSFGSDRNYWALFVTPAFDGFNDLDGFRFALGKKVSGLLNEKLESERVPLSVETIDVGNGLVYAFNEGPYNVSTLEDESSQVHLDSTSRKDGYVLVRDIASKLGLKIGTVRRLLRKGGLQGKVGWGYPIEDVIKVFPELGEN